MTGTLWVRNRQRVRRVNTVLLRRILRSLLSESFDADSCDLCFHLVGAREMSRINKAFLGHEGSTDVITFDHGDVAGESASLRGEIFICLDDADEQARVFRTTWMEELVRYAIHGLLHLQGYDDMRPAARRVMKREENRLLRELKKRFTIAQLGRTR